MPAGGAAARAAAVIHAKHQRQLQEPTAHKPDEQLLREKSAPQSQPSTSEAVSRPPQTNTDGGDEAKNAGPGPPSEAFGLADAMDLKRSAEPVEITPGHGFWKYQPFARRTYKNLWVQIGVACLISGNFLMNALQKQFDPDEDRSPELFEGFELFFNIAFTMELGLNMYGFWLRDFWMSGWNIFDFLVVTIGLLTTFKVPLPGPLSMLRMMRAFRVFRLFKRVKSLNKIMVSLARAVPGMRDAFIILLLVMCIYAILAVEFFQEAGENFEIINENGQTVALVTGRGQTFGYEYFGNFLKALYTMFQVLTGDSWSEVIARPLIHRESPLEGVAYACFFVSFIIVNAIVLINVVVAVLLEKMVEDPSESAVETGSQEGEGARAAAVQEVSAHVQAFDADVTAAGKEKKLSDDVASMKQEVTSLKGMVAEIILAMQKAGLEVQAVSEEKCLGTKVGLILSDQL
mmetsp:Transcript_22582/g.51685  ORF Transcript_22582/g.51685 Transcript_22582/m.51685 type:complete len:460 (-) Transcript_22582:85-1464(-)